VGLREHLLIVQVQRRFERRKNGTTRTRAQQSHGQPATGPARGWEVFQGVDDSRTPAVIEIDRGDRGERPPILA
jgi:hypothetical protein